jgi:hypothetical protein
MEMEDHAALDDLAAQKAWLEVADMTRRNLICDR